MDSHIDPPTGNVAASPQEFREALARVLESKTLSSRARLREFLSYVVGEVLDGHSTEIKEQAIGVAVFGRTPNYLVHEDTIVRVSARQLRQKLEEYYRFEGQQDAFIIDMPKGSYVPRCLAKKPACADSPSIKVHSPAVAARIPALLTSRRTAWGIAACMTLLCGLLLWSARTADGAGSRVEARPATLLDLLLPDRGQRVAIVCGDGVVQVFKYLTGDAPSLEAYQTRQYVQAESITALTSRENKVWDVLKHRQLLATGSLHLMVNLVQHLPPDRVMVRHPMDVSVRDFYDGSAILLSGPFANPWVKLFEERLNFRIEQTSETHVYIRNVSPLAGEPTEYQLHVEEGKRKTYARLALLPNLGGTGKVLLIGGPSTPLMELMGAAAADPHFLAELLAHFESATPDELPHCEVLMEMVEMANAPIESRIVAIREIGDVVQTRERYQGISSAMTQRR